MQPGHGGGEQVPVWCVPGQVQPDASRAAGDGPGYGEQLQAEPFWFPAAGSGAGQCEHLHPGGQLGGQLGDGDPDLVVREPGPGQVAQAGVLGVADPVLAAGPVAVPQLQVGQLAAGGDGGRTRSTGCRRRR